MSNIANAAEAVPQFIQRLSLHIVFASTSGHTEYVVDALINSLKSITPGWEIEETMAEKTQPQDLLCGGVLLLASSTWNTGSIEGQLNPHMWVLLHDRRRLWTWPANRVRASDSGTIDTFTRRERQIICRTTLKPIMAG